MNSEEIKKKIALLRGQGNQVDLAGVLADVLEAIIDTPAPPANDPRIVGAVSAQSPATIGAGVTIGGSFESGSNVVIGTNSKLGTDVNIGGCIQISDSVMIGQNTRIVGNSEIGLGVRIGDNVEINVPVLSTDDGFSVGDYGFAVNSEDLFVLLPNGERHAIHFDY